MAMTYQEARLECLRLARTFSSTPSQTVAAARELADFVEGTNDAGVVDAARQPGRRMVSGRSSPGLGASRRPGDGFSLNGR